MDNNKIIEVDYIQPPVITTQNVSELIDIWFFKFWEGVFPEGFDYNTLSKTVRTTSYKTCMRFIHDNLFKTDNSVITSHCSILTLDNMDLLQAVCDKYLQICDLYNKQLGLFGFALLVGYDPDVVISWGQNATRPEYRIYKDIKQHLKDSSEDCLKDSDLGRIAVANNSVEVGLNYGYAAAAQQAAAAAAPKLENIASRYGKPPAITD